jgi:hypothetical protein
MEVRIASLREEIYRQMYLMAQGRDATATANAMSGYSKQLDMVPAGDIQNCFGDIVRAGMEQLLNDVAIIRATTSREQPIQFSIRGFSFVETPVMEEINAAQSFAGLQIPSASAEKENLKKVVAARFKDKNPTETQVMFDEIDAAPTMEERQQMEMQQQQDQFSQQFEAKAEHETELEKIKQAGKEKAKEKK